MVDLVLLGKALLTSALAAAVIMGLATRGSPGVWRRGACWSWAVGAGVLVASGFTDQWPHLPALEDRARFLTFVLPWTLVVETVAAAKRSTRAAWIMRVPLAAIVAPVLLHNSIYVADLNGPGSAEWSLAQTILTFGALALLLVIVWAVLTALESRTSTRTIHWVLLLDALVAAITVMLSSYFRGGVLGLGIAGAIAGATLSSYVSLPAPITGGSFGMSLVGIYSVVMIGRFFGNLSSGLALCLLLAPLAAWVVELPRLRGLPSRRRALARLACVAAPLILVLVIAQRTFVAASAAQSRPFQPGVVDTK